VGSIQKKIHEWSVKNSQDFWSVFWDFSKIKGVKSKKKIKKSKVFYKNIFLPNSTLNFGNSIIIYFWLFKFYKKNFTHQDLGLMV